MELLSEVSRSNRLSSVLLVSETHWRICYQEIKFSAELTLTVTRSADDNAEANNCWFQFKDIDWAGEKFRAKKKNKFYTKTLSLHIDMVKAGV